MSQRGMRYAWNGKWGPESRVPGETPSPQVTSATHKGVAAKWPFHFKR